MRLLFLSDVHGNLIALEKVLADAGSFDSAICAGDLVGYGPDPNGCVQKAVEGGFRSVAGNHDYSVVTGDTSDFNPHAAAAIEVTRRIMNGEMMDRLRHLPRKLDFSLEGVRIVVLHGSPRDPLNEYVFPEEAELRAKEFLEMTGAKLLVLGHTHVPYIFVEGGEMMINPGSVGQPRDRDARASYMVAELDKGNIEVAHRRVEYDIGETASRMRSLGIPEFLARRLYYGY